jgi:hypothetical protein
MASTLALEIRYYIKPILTDKTLADKTRFKLHASGSCRRRPNAFFNHVLVQLCIVSHLLLISSPLQIAKQTFTLGNINRVKGVAKSAKDLSYSQSGNFLPQQHFVF